MLGLQEVLPYRLAASCHWQLHSEREPKTFSRWQVLEPLLCVEVRPAVSNWKFSTSCTIPPESWRLTSLTLASAAKDQTTQHPVQMRWLSTRGGFLFRAVSSRTLWAKGQPPGVWATLCLSPPLGPHGSEVCGAACISPGPWEFLLTLLGGWFSVNAKV